MLHGIEAEKAAPRVRRPVIGSRYGVVSAVCYMKQHALLVLPSVALFAVIVTVSSFSNATTCGSIIQLHPFC